MKIEINLKIVFLIVLFFLINQIQIYCIFLVFIILHEIAHMITGMMLGFKPRVFKIQPFGVSIEFYNYNTYKSNVQLKRIVTYLAGPLSNLLFAFIIYIIRNNFYLKEEMLYTNFVIAIFNLIPILPLDGGKILKEIMKKIFGNKFAIIFMINSSKIILALLSLLYSILIFKIKNVSIFLIILYMWYLYVIEEKNARSVIKAYEAIENNKDVL